MNYWKLLSSYRTYMLFRIQDEFGFFFFFCSNCKQKIKKIYCFIFIMKNSSFPYCIVKKMFRRTHTVLESGYSNCWKIRIRINKCNSRVKIWWACLENYPVNDFARWDGREPWARGGVVHLTNDRVSKNVQIRSFHLFHAGGLSTSFSGAPTVIFFSHRFVIIVYLIYVSPSVLSLLLLLISNVQVQSENRISSAAVRFEFIILRYHWYPCTCWLHKLHVDKYGLTYWYSLWTLINSFWYTCQYSVFVAL